MSRSTREEQEMVGRENEQIAQKPGINDLQT